jgi:PAB1-binding protein PBP1
MLSKAKIADELPLLTDKPDTAYRMLKALELVEIIEMSSTSKITLVRLTEKGRTWNTSEIYPSKVGKKSEVRSENSPTNQDTNNQDTNNQKSPCHPQADDIPFDAIVDTYNRVCGKTFKGAIALTPKRKTNIKTLYHLKIGKGKPFKEKGLQFWEAYFSDCLQNPHWRGQNDRGWKADLEFLTRPEVATKMLEATLS